VLLRAGEVLEQVPVALRRHDPEIETEVVVRDDGRFRAALGGDLSHPRERDEVLDQRLGVGGRRDDVDVADRLPPAAGAAGFRDLLRGRMRSELRDRLEHQRQRVAEQRPLRRVRPRRGRQRLEDVLLALRP
jgi:hypothetical protein